MRSPIVLMLCLAPLAAGQLTEAQVVKASKAGVKTALAVLKQDVNAARDTFLDAVEAMEGDFEAGNGSLDDFDDLFAQAEVLQQAVQDAVQIAEGIIVTKIHDALADLDGGDIVNGKVPQKLQTGSGGVPDAARSGIDKVLAKAYAALDARLDKTEALVRKLSNLRLRASIRPPAGATAFLASGGATAVFDAGFGVDLVWVEHDNTLGDSGRLRVGGTQDDVGASGGLDVTVFEADQTFHQADDAAAALSGDRWSATVGGLDRGTHAFVVAGHVDAPAASLAEAFSVPD